MPRTLAGLVVAAVFLAGSGITHATVNIDPTEILLDGEAVTSRV